MSVAEGNDFFEGDRGLDDHAGDQGFAFFDPLGNFDLALTGEQRDLAHLAQVHAHRVAGPAHDVGVKLGFLFAVVTAG